MITIDEIREELLTCKKPLFFFHDDADGLCSFLLLYRYIKEGKGVVVKASFGVDEMFLRKVGEYQPDKVFITDMAVVTQDFIRNVKVPIILIDHHPVKEKVRGVKYYNPRLENPDLNIPATKICYDIVQQDMWIGAVGTIGDWVYIESFMKEVKKQYPKLLNKKIKTPESALFDSEFGKLAKIFNFILKGKITDINKCIKILTRISGPEEILEQTTSPGKFIYKKYESVVKPYENLLKMALKKASDDKFLIFPYASDESFTGELSNELLYRFSDKIIIIAREKSDEMRCSLRSPKNINVREILMKSLVGIEGRGGGHEQACGVSVKREQWDTFIENMRNNLDKQSS